MVAVQKKYYGLVAVLTKNCDHSSVGLRSCSWDSATQSPAERVSQLAAEVHFSHWSNRSILFYC